MTAIQNFSEPKTLKRIAALVVAAGVLTAGSASAMTAGTYTSTGSRAVTAISRSK